MRWTAQALVVGTALFGLAACGSTSGSKAAAAKGKPNAAPQTINIEMIGKIDADKGEPGTFTSKEHWPAFAPSDVKVPAGATVVLTIKEYDDMATALPDGSPYNDVKGGTETVDGKPVTTVANADISHTITIPQLGINIPLAKAPEDGFTTIVFTFKAPKAGTYEFECLTPCGSDPNGMGGAMQTDGWMKGHLVVS